MSLIQEKRVVPASEQTVTVAIICELCRSVGRQGRCWEGGLYGVNEVEVKLTTGESYPEHSSLELHTIDICPECFVTKLVPWIEAQGGKVRKQEVDY